MKFHGVIQFISTFSAPLRSQREACRASRIATVFIDVEPPCMMGIAVNAPRDLASGFNGFSPNTQGCIYPDWLWDLISR